MVERTKEEYMEEKPLIEHLRELAYRLRRMLISLFVTFLIYFMIGIQTVENGHTPSKVELIIMGGT
ncbi:hypothetical protein DJ524_09950, partial [Sulfolobus sp. D5]